jgi:hypothetical protein
MQRRVPQSQLVEPSTFFSPTSTWTRISFLDLLAPDGGARTPLYRLEAAYDDRGATLIAVWPFHSDLEQVRVTLCKPSTAIINRLAAMQVDWPPALSDQRIRVDPLGEVHLVPCRTSIAHLAAYTDTDEAARVLRALERGARAIGRELSLTV